MATPTPGFVATLRTPQALTHLNLTQHSALGPPIHPSGEPATPEHMDARGIDNLRVPILVGTPRSVDTPRGEALVLDLVFAPILLERALRRHEFDDTSAAAVTTRAIRLRLVELAIAHAEEELGYKLPRDYTLPRGRLPGGANYKGGLADDGLRPVPMAALRQLIAQVEANARREALEAAPGPWRSNHAALAREVRLAEPTKVSAPSAGVLKRGFLNGAKAELYPDGSSEGMHPEGAGDPLGWMPKGLRDRVHMVDQSQAEGMQADAKLAAPPPQPPPAASAPSATATSNEATPDAQYVLEEDGDALTLHVALPGVVAMESITFDVSDEACRLRAAGRFKLDLRWPRAVDSSCASARFKKRTSELVVRAPVTSRAI